MSQQPFASNNFCEETEYSVILKMCLTSLMTHTFPNCSYFTTLIIMVFTYCVYDEFSSFSRAKDVWETVMILFLAFLVLIDYKFLPPTTKIWPMKCTLTQHALRAAKGPRWARARLFSNHSPSGSSRSSGPISTRVEREFRRRLVRPFRRDQLALFRPAFKPRLNSVSWAWLSQISRPASEPGAGSMSTRLADDQSPYGRVGRPIPRAS